MFLRSMTTGYTGSCSDKINKLKKELESADAVVIGAGAGLSTSAGLTYSGKRFEKYFSDFARKYGIRDMYSGGFFPYQSLEEHWAWWSRHIYVNRYMPAPKDTYNCLLKLVEGKDYFVLTTNVDHCFQKAGFDKKRLFYTQGDYGLFQCSKPCCQRTYDNRDEVMKMLISQGFRIEKSGILSVGGKLSTMIPSELVPRCPVCGKPMAMNLRCDDSFVRDDGWYAAASGYEEFLRRHSGLRVLFLEQGVGSNTPAIIKYPFWQMTAKNPKAVYACINYGEAFCPDEIANQSVCINSDIDSVLRRVLTN